VSVGEKSHLVASPIFFDHFDRALPALKLRGVQFSQMQDLTLQHPLTANAQTFTQRIINMRQAVFADAVGL